MRLQLTNAILNRLEKYTVELRTPFVNQEIPQKQKWFRELPLKYVLGIANKGLRNILCSPSCRCRRQKSYFTVKYPIKSVAYFSFFLTLAVQFSAVTHSCPTLCNPTHCSMPGLPVHHQPPELAQTHVHRVGDAIQPSHPLLTPSPPAFNLSQLQSFPVSQFFASGGQSIGILASASVLQ